MDYQELKQLEDDLWEAADQLRANSRLTAAEYSMPVLGLIFLRHASNLFHSLPPTLEAERPTCGHLYSRTCIGHACANATP